MHSREIRVGKFVFLHIYIHAYTHTADSDDDGYYYRIKVRFFFFSLFRSSYTRRATHVYTIYVRTTCARERSVVMTTTDVSSFPATAATIRVVVVLRSEFPYRAFRSIAIKIAAGSGIRRKINVQRKNPTTPQAV